MKNGLCQPLSEKCYTNRERVREEKIALAEVGLVLENVGKEGLFL